MGVPSPGRGRDPARLPAAQRHRLPGLGLSSAEPVGWINNLAGRSRSDRMWLEREVSETLQNKWVDQ
jgi:hypothetical protein